VINISSGIYPELPQLLKQWPGCVLATVVHTEGSTPQKAGSSALIGASGLITGTIGGGKTEFKVIEEAQLLIRTKKSVMFTFELHGEITSGSESICGGSMIILIDATPEEHLPVFTRLKYSLDQRQPGVLLTLADASDSSDVKVVRQWVAEENQTLEQRLKNLRPVVTEMMHNVHAESVRTVPFDGMETLAIGCGLVERIVPNPSLIIAGAGHVGQALAHLGKFLGFSVTVWDDRAEYADPSKIADADVVLTGPMEDSLSKIAIRNDCYLVVVTRGHKTDGEVLRQFIGSDAAYIGMMGSKAKIAKMKTSFFENGWATPEQWNRIHTPVGLDIGGQTVEEIAISIAAELVKVRNRKNASNE
jgi:xanthine dehydrogenase accessory factor